MNASPAVLSNNRQDTVAVVGGGQMGGGIAHTFALHGYRVLLVERDPATGESALKSVENNLRRQAKKGAVDDGDIAAIMARIHLADRIEFAAPPMLTVEAVTEDLAVKISALKAIDRAAGENALIATNTSSIRIAKLAAAVRNPSRFCGMHFMNPAPLMPLVEVVQGAQSSEATVAAVRTIAVRLGKTAVCVRDSPGFVCNRLLMPMLNEAIFALAAGVAAAPDIDAAIRLGLRHPMGPLALADLIGLEVCLAIMRVLHQEFGEEKYRPCPLLEKMVAAGCLGRKTGLGFYDYRGQSPTANPRLPS